MTASRILTPRDIRIGGGSRYQLAGLLASLGVRRPLIVTDPAIAAVGHLADLCAHLADHGVAFATFTDVVEDPTDVSVDALVTRMTHEGVDVLVALGGGSAIDTAKAAAAAASTGEPPSALKVPRIVDAPTLHVIAIPTTAGTGSEVTRAAVITETATKEKMLILGTSVLPVAALIDYELTLTCPYRVTVDTGIDALTHALEALVNRNATPHSDALAISALRQIGAHLERAATDPGDRTAREAMMYGAFHAGLAVSHTSTALIHGLSRPLGAFFQVPHGMSNAMVLPLVTSFSYDAAPERYAMAATALGLPTPEGGVGDPGRDLALAFEAMNGRLGVPTPQAFGIDREAYHALVPDMARQGLASGTPANNPRVATEAEMGALYRSAYEGRLDFGRTTRSDAAIFSPSSDCA